MVLPLISGVVCGGVVGFGTGWIFNPRGAVNRPIRVFAHGATLGVISVAVRALLGVKAFYVAIGLLAINFVAQQINVARKLEETDEASRRYFGSLANQRLNS